ncbi:MAG TPA: M6 family metalloprotease domain-containing protein, partial [Geobacteraceae bacterium]
MRSAMQFPGNVAAILLLITLLCSFPSIPGPALAVPAAPVVHRLEQPGNGDFAARQWGDENGSGWETEDGFTIVRDEETDGWAYAEHGHDGALVSSKRYVGRDLPPGHVDKQIRPKGQATKGRKLKTTTRESASAEGGGGLASPAPPGPAALPPASGTGYLPVILINFNNTATTYTPADFSNLLFGNGTWSMRDYYSEASYGTFTVSAGPAGVSGWVTASNTHDYYGQNDTYGNDRWPGDLVYEAAQAADATVDFSAYDRDGDCYVDVVAVVHQGSGAEASGVTTDIWSHRWNLFSAAYYGNSHYSTYTTNDHCTASPSQFVKVNDYIIQPEKYGSGLSTVGVFCHEYGHSFGLPDLYDTDDTSEGVGNWSLMAAGSWTYVSRGGDRPAHMDPWSKYKLGWIVPTRLTATATGKSFAGIETTADYYQVRYGGPQAATSEYFLLENRQKSGFDAGLPGSGLLLWHIDEVKASNSGEWYPGCTGCTSHYKVALVQADNLFNMEKNNNRGDGGDPFPGTTNKRAVNDATSPNNNLYSGAASGFALANISASGTTMTADVVMTDVTAPVTTITAAPALHTTARSGSFSFSASESALIDCRLDNGSYTLCTSPYTFASLPDADHTFSVRATDLIGNVETPPTTYSWNIDNAAPATTITGKPSDPSTSDAATFTFTA